jgi:hypothetical protein
LNSKESTSFLKKSSKKLLFTGGFGESAATARIKRKFFGSFFQKRTSCLLSLRMADCAALIRPTLWGGWA